MFSAGPSVLASLAVLIVLIPINGLIANLMFSAGPSVLAGLAVLIVLIPINGLIANQIKKLQVKQMKYKDKRVKMMN